MTAAWALQLFFFPCLPLLSSLACDIITAPKRRSIFSRSHPCCVSLLCQCLSQSSIFLYPCHRWLISPCYAGEGGCFFFLKREKKGNNRIEILQSTGKTRVQSIKQGWWRWFSIRKTEGRVWRNGQHVMKRCAVNQWLHKVSLWEQLTCCLVTPHCHNVCRHAQTFQKTEQQQKPCRALHYYTALYHCCSMVHYKRLCVGEWVREGAVCLWLAFQTSPLHKITSWEDNLWACDNLFRLMFLQSVKATDRWRGSAGDQYVYADYVCLETLPTVSVTSFSTETIKIITCVK